MYSSTVTKSICNSYFPPLIIIREMHFCAFDSVTAEKKKIGFESLVSGQFVSKCMFLNNFLKFCFNFWREISRIVVKYLISYQQSSLCFIVDHQAVMLPQNSVGMYSFGMYLQPQMLPVKSLPDWAARQQVNCI